MEERNGGRESSYPTVPSLFCPLVKYRRLFFEQMKYKGEEGGKRRGNSPNSAFARPFISPSDVGQGKRNKRERKRKGGGGGAPFLYIFCRCRRFLRRRKGGGGERKGRGKRGEKGTSLICSKLGGQLVDEFGT